MGKKARQSDTNARVGSVLRVSSLLLSIRGSIMVRVVVLTCFQLSGIFRTCADIRQQRFVLRR